MENVSGKEIHIHPDTKHRVHRNPEPTGVLPLISAGTGCSPHASINLAIVLHEGTE